MKLIPNVCVATAFIITTFPLIEAQKAGGRNSISFKPPHPGAYFTTHPPSAHALADADPHEVAHAFMRSHMPEHADNYYIRKDSYTDANSGVSHVYIRQVVDGLEVADGNINLNIRDGKVLSYGNSVSSTISRYLLLLLTELLYDSSSKFLATLRPLPHGTTRTIVIICLTRSYAVPPFAHHRTVHITTLSSPTSRILVQRHYPSCSLLPLIMDPGTTSIPCMQSVFHASAPSEPPARAKNGSFLAIHTFLSLSKLAKYLSKRPPTTRHQLRTSTSRGVSK